MTESLASIIARAKCSVHLTANQHRAYYQTIADYLGDKASEIPDDILFRMLETDTLIEVQVYPDTPIGSFTIYHYDVTEAIEAAWKALDKSQPTAAGKE